MNNRTARTFALAAAGTVAAGVALVALAGSASAVGAAYNGTPIGTLDLRPDTGNNNTPVDYTSSAGCPGGVSFETRLFGFGMPDAGEIVTARTTAGFSSSGPITSSFSDTFQAFADKNATTLQGRYDVVLRCTDRFGDTSRGDFRGIVTFSSPTAYAETQQGASPSPSPSASATRAPSPAASPSPSATPTASMSPSPRPSTTTPAASPSAPACGSAETVSLGQSTIIAGGAGTVRVTGTPNSVIDLFAYTRPSTTYRVVRSAELGNNGTADFTVTPPANTRLYAQQRGCPQSLSQVLNVRTALSLSAQRTGTRTYTFSGSSAPAREGGLIISLYRVTDDGRQILTSQTRASSGNGAWSLSRTFLGTGRFGFVVRTGQDMTNAPGASAIRSVTIS